MVFLNSFHMLSKEEDEEVFNARNPRYYIQKTSMTCYSSKYPFQLFRDREFPEYFDFRDITIFCGNNGSGKSTILNVIAEKLRLHRNTPYNRSDFFDDYVRLCKYDIEKMPGKESCIITSDDVFDHVLGIRRLNSGIDNRREELINEYIKSHPGNTDTAETALNGLDDYKRWRDVHDARGNKSQSSYLRSRLMRNVTERSNGESALSFFVDSISDGCLCLLDEPENSLSPSNQLELKYFIEDTVRYHNCQFIISTHSPFMLSLKGAKIYDIDSVPVRTCKWTELDSIRTYFDFFSEHTDEFSGQ